MELEQKKSVCVTIIKLIGNSFPFNLALFHALIFPVHTQLITGHQNLLKSERQSNGREHKKLTYI